MEFIALGTRYKEGKKGKVIIREPFKIYAIRSVKRSVGMPPFYRVVGVNNGGELDLKDLSSGTQEYTHVLKWVGIPDMSPGKYGRYGGRFLLKDSNSDSSSIINEEEARKLISSGCFVFPE